MNGINPFGGSGGSDSDSNEVINSPFGPTIGPAQEVHTSPAISPTNSSSSTDTVKGPILHPVSTSSSSHTYPPKVGFGWNSELNSPTTPKSSPGFNPYSNKDFSRYFRED
jgi:hypothetical protein